MMTITRRIALAGSLALTLTTSALAQAQTTVELWSFLDPVQDNSRAKALKHVIDTFESANPSIKIKTSVIQWQEISPQLLRAARANRVPDVVMVFSPQLQTQIAAGTLASLEDRLAKMPDRNDLVVLSEGKDRQGNSYAVPWEMRVGGIMYRKDLLDKAGLPVPKTLPELAEAAGKLGTEGKIGFGLGFKPTNPDAGLAWFVPTAVAMGAKILRADGTPDFASPEMIQLTQFTHDLVHKYKAMSLDAALMGDTEVQQLAEGSRTVFLAKGSHRLQFIREKSGLANNIQMMAVPTFTPGKPAPAIVQGWTLAIPKASKNQEAAWKFIQHWTSTDIQIYQAEKAGYLPVRRSASTAPALKDPKNAHVAWALDYAAQHPFEFNWPENPDFLYATLAKALEQVVTNQSPPKDALIAAEKAYAAGMKTSN
jgi:ABC-type glycerol-3-phosphate transport system substrate-binding protein